MGGIKLHGIDVAGIIGKEIGVNTLTDAAHACTLVKVTPGTRTTGQLTGGTNPTTSNHACRAFIDRQARGNRPASLVNATDVVIQVIGETIEGGVIPTVNDRIIAEGTTWYIRGVDRDPCEAVYTLTCSAV